MPPAPNKLGLWARRLGPWLIAGAIVVVLARRYPPADVLAQLRAGSWRATLPYPFLLPFGYVLTHGLWDTIVLRGVIVPREGSPVTTPRYVEIIRGRVGTSLLMLLGFFFGAGGFGLWLARRTGASARVVSGAIAHTMLSDLAALGLIAFVATTLGHADVPGAVRSVAIGVAVVPVCFVVLGPWVLARTRSQFLAPWRELSRGAALLQMIGRALDLSVVVLITWQAARAFGLAIPLVSFVTYLPVVLLVTSLPFNVGGIGAAQAAWLVFLPWASGEKLLAFQIVWQLFFGLGIVVRGVPFVRGVVREISAGPAAQPA